MWEQIRSNQTRSTMLVAAMAALLLLVGFLIGFYIFDNGWGGVLIALAVWVVMSLVAYYGGDSILIAMSAGFKIKPEDYPSLYNVVEEMKIASGLEKMPDIYIVYDQALNAFATGANPEKASVAVTSGLLQKLTRDELQGVIGHEIAHIKNRDVLLMSVCSVMLGAIILLGSFISRFFFLGGRFRVKRISPGAIPLQLILAAVLLVVAVLAPLAARLIYFSISRRREYLADASSALYTRYPEGLASALEKIGSSGWLMMSADPATAPMYIINPFLNKDSRVNELTSTHPPLRERINILRAMGAGASYADYNTGYGKVRLTDRGIVSRNEAAMIGAVEKRVGSAAEKPPGDPVIEKITRRREVSDVMLRLNKYRIYSCDCGAKWKIPRDFKDDTVLCTRCGGRVRIKENAGMKQGG